jgi:hypothetical protein
MVTKLLRLKYMYTKVIFNGKHTKMSLKEIKDEVVTHGSFSGSIKMGNTSLIFNCVNSHDFDYYIDVLNKEKNTKPETEVTFDIRTDAIEAINL